MKKVFVLLLVIILASVLIVSGCSTSTPTTTTPDTSTTTPSDTGTQKVYKLKYATPYMAVEPPTITGQFFCDYIMEKSNGQIEVTTYAGGSLGADTEMFDLVKSGGADIVTVMGQLFQDAIPLAGAVQQIYNASNGEASDFVHEILFDNPETAPILQKEFEQQNIELMCYYSAGAGTIITNFLPASNLADLQGKKMGCFSDMPWIEEIGLHSTTGSPQDLYESLSRGVYDCCFMAVGPLEMLKIQEVAKALVILNTTGVNMSLLMNLETWNSLTPELQQICREAALLAEGQSVEMLNQMEAATLKAFEEEYGVQVNVLSPEDQATVYNAMYGEWEKAYRELCERANVVDNGEIVIKNVKAFALSK